MEQFFKEIRLPFHSVSGKRSLDRKRNISEFAFKKPNAEQWEHKIIHEDIPLSRKFLISDHSFR